THKVHSSVKPNIESPSPSERDPLLQNSQSPNLDSGQQTKDLSLYEIVIPNRPLQHTLVCQAFHSFTHMSHRVVIPLVYSTSIPKGGLGLSPYQIGVILGVFGVCNAVLQILVWKPLLKQMGPKRMFTLSYTFHFVRIFMMMLARIVASNVGHVNWLVWALIFVQMAASSLAATSMNAISTIIVKTAPPSAVGAVNGIQQMISSGLRGLSPVVISPLFAASLALDWKVSGEAGGFARYTVDVVQMGIIAVGVWYSLKLPSYRLI
ncbi:hypothetical protein V5O48_018382, partial [Marasmius crinis-equi]